MYKRLVNPTKKHSFFLFVIRSQTIPNNTFAFWLVCLAIFSREMAAEDLAPVLLPNFYCFNQ